MGQKEGGEREQVIACTMIEHAMPRQGKRWHPSANGVAYRGTLAMRSPQFQA